ncbi:MAG: YajQ family cyclic di-GMP-binding protein [Gemmatimonadota bacterium]|nr:YajQ family cyclic di-GMP-binding protein [Gemmatimonadota bacterium]MDH3367316.1 YajQ family cyclic di-GMP-binding protein [Gemmatimonadota bacterium]MDH3477339.1 YajQ family cyclic di-GMP-binding protein [Gemmatimonadota bacterium]MDH3568920.1 YajQ family cyclic di-GMP-binding protein [Gemmatimonadota bacterium]MDH5549656.1 YajQ family cyclic di-GMP-binding protein [Gemmatimonadota bacterium]
MSPNASFDISTGADLQEVDNAVNQALKEVAQRYDFKGTTCTIELDRKAAVIRLEADDEFQINALNQLLDTKLVKRKVPLKNVKVGESEAAAGGRVRRLISLTQGIPDDVARQIVKDVKGQGLKKAQIAIQGDELRVTSPSRDTLQEVITFLRSQDYGIELTFGNYRP